MPAVLHLFFLWINYVVFTIEKWNEQTNDELIKGKK